VQKAIDDMKKELGKVTCVVIAHRLSTIKNADKIIVLKSGQIAEVGNHETLLSEFPTGIYAKLVED
jgi:ABC-type multidrug transport system fused ATPase/permease subunit